MSRSFPLSVHSWADAAVSSCFLVVSESPNPEVPPHMSGSVINADSSCHQTQAPLSVHLFNITGALAQQAHGRLYHPPVGIMLQRLLRKWLRHKFSDKADDFEHVTCQASHVFMCDQLFDCHQEPDEV